MRRQLCILMLFPFLMTTACAYVDDPSDTVGDPPAERRVTVYEIVDREGRLHLESARVTAPATGSPAKAAVEALLGHEPTADGHSSLWAGLCQPGAGVHAVQVGEHQVTVRLRDFGPGEPGNAACDLSGEGWRMQRQQVAWTARKATGSPAPVEVRLRGGYRLMPPTTASKAALSAH